MQTMIGKATVAGLMALLVAGFVLVVTERASAAQWQGRGGGWHGGRQFGPHAGGRYGFGARGFWQGSAFGWRGGSWRGQFGRDRFVGVGYGGPDRDEGRLWHAGYWNGGLWNAGWWGPASTVAVVDVYPSDSSPDSACWQVQPVYSANGAYLGQQIINLCQ